LTKPFEAERLLDIADAFLVELGSVPGMPGHLYARYFQRPRIAKAAPTDKSARKPWPIRQHLRGEGSRR
jgi:hypothetical protein